MPGPTEEDERRMRDMNPPERRPMAEALVRNGWRVRRRDSGGYIWHKVTKGTPEFPIGAEMREENIPEEQKR